MAAFVEFCTNHQLAQPPDKIVKNLCTFLCQDAEQTPTFAHHRKVTDGILSFQSMMKEGSKPTAPQRNVKEKDKDKLPDIPKLDESSKSRLSRRGAGLAFNELSAKFNSNLFHAIPNMWQSMAGGLLSTFKTGICFFSGC